MELLTDPLRWLLILIVILVAVWITYLVQFVIRCYRMRHEIEEYQSFVDESYTQKGKKTPTFILRIQRDIIQDYNKSVNNRIGSLLRIKQYPEGDELPEMEENYFDS